MQKITPFLWFSHNAEDAMNFYTSVFKNSKISRVSRYSEAGPGAPGSVMVCAFEIEGTQFNALNGGPVFELNPSISFFVYRNSIEGVNALYEKLSEGGEVMMALDKYPFSDRYAFFKDKFGVSWQVMLSKEKEQIVPCLLFVGKDLGKADAAVKLYTDIFKNSKVKSASHYPNGNIMHTAFQLEGQAFTAMDGEGPHKFGFDEATSFVINCKDQEEIDYYWNKLTHEGIESQCGWLKDKFGVSWQVVPSNMAYLIQNSDPKKAANIMQTMFQMKKLDIQKLKDAAK